MPIFKDAGSSVAGSYRQILLDSRKSQLRLTVANVRRLEKTFDAAIQSIVSRVAALPEARQGTEWHRAQLNLIASIRTTMDALRKDYDSLLEAGMTELAQTAAQRQIATGALVEAAPDKSLFPDLSRTFSLSDGSSVIVEFGQLAVDAVERAANRYYRDGLKLSDRLYTMNARGRRDIENTIIQGLTEQVSARDLARRLEKNLLEAGSANVRYDAMRIARTEINNAHREASILSATTGDGRTFKDYISGIRWNLSASHKQLDICFRKGTLVQCIDGSKPIEECKAGDAVLTHLGNYQNVTRLYRHTIPAGSLVRLCFRGARNRIHSLILTPNHPVLIDRGWVVAGDLRTGDVGVRLPSRMFLPYVQSEHDMNDKASRDFAGNAPLSDSQSANGGLYGARSQGLLDRLRRYCLNVQLTTLRPAFETGIGKSWSRRSNSDSCLPYDPPTISAATLQTVTTCQDGVSQNWGYLSQAWGHKHCNNTFSNATSVGILDGKSDKHESSQHDRLGNIRLSKTFVSLFGLRRILRIASYRFDKYAQRGYCAPSIAPSTNDCRRFSEYSTGLPSAPLNLARAAFRNVRMFLSYIYCTLRGGEIPSKLISISQIDTTGEEVFNLGVAEDNSYFANGIAVHNCDVYAGYDGGAGPGVYEASDVPADHPHGLCFLTDVLKAFPESGIGGRKPDMANVPASQIRYYAGQGDPVARAVLAGG